MCQDTAQIRVIVHLAQNGNIGVLGHFCAHLVRLNWANQSSEDE